MSCLRTRPGIEPRPLNLEGSVPNIRPHASRRRNVGRLDKICDITSDIFLADDKRYIKEHETFVSLLEERNKSVDKILQEEWNLEEELEKEKNSRGMHNFSCRWQVQSLPIQ